MRDSNQTKITISLKKAEREEIKGRADRQGLAVPTYCAQLLRAAMTENRLLKELESLNELLNDEMETNAEAAFLNIQTIREAVPLFDSVLLIYGPNEAYKLRFREVKNEALRKNRDLADYIKSRYGYEAPKY